MTEEASRTQLKERMMLLEAIADDRYHTRSRDEDDICQHEAYLYQLHVVHNDLVESMADHLYMELPP
jgi:hypothetical protein